MSAVTSDGEHGDTAVVPTLPMHPFPARVTRRTPNTPFSSAFVSAKVDKTTGIILSLENGVLWRRWRCVVSLPAWFPLPNWCKGGISSLYHLAVRAAVGCVGFLDIDRGDTAPVLFMLLSGDHDGMQLAF
jgi:hypothetical protein